MNSEHRDGLCPLCAGEGWVTEDDFARARTVPPAGLFVDGRTEVCPLCDGDGRADMGGRLDGCLLALAAGAVWVLLVGAWHVWEAFAR